jgi:hypothetical protein
LLERQVPARIDRGGAAPPFEPTPSPWSPRSLGEAP